MKDRIVINNSGTHYFLCGNEVTEKAYRAVYPLPEWCGGADLPAGAGAWPMLSDALAVHPRQIPEALARDRAHGLDTEYHPGDGRMVLRDRGQRRQVLKSLGLHDNDGAYGDG